MSSQPNPLQAFFARRAETKTRITKVFDSVRDAEPALLRALVGENENTEFGRKHDFRSIRSVADYRRAVPISSYDDYAADVERIADGARDVLTAAPITLFRRTSGTTGATKRIPATARSLQVDFDCLHLSWGQPFESFPELLDEPTTILNMITNPRQAPHLMTKAGIPWRAYSDHIANLGGGGEPMAGFPGSASPWFDSGEVMSATNLAYYRLRHGLASKVKALMSVNPSTIVALGHTLDAQLEQLVDEVARGTLFGQPRFTPDPERAKELTSLRKKGRIRLHHIWPELKYALTWKSASCELYLGQVQAEIGDAATIFPFGYCASDGTFAMHLDDHHVGGFLLPHGVFYEFAPAGHDLKPDTPTLSVWELEVGREYHLVHTAWNGFYRYAIGDLFRVIEMVRGIPRVEYSGRHGSFSSFTGEKITDRHVVSATLAAARSLEVSLANFTCCPRWGDPPHYAFVVEPADGAPVDGVALAARIDEELALHNDEYPSKRKSGRLDPVQVHVVSGGTFVRYRDYLADNGASAPTQMKEKPLQKDDAPLPILQRLGTSPG